MKTETKSIRELWEAALAEGKGGTLGGLESFLKDYGWPTELTKEVPEVADGLWLAEWKDQAPFAVILLVRGGRVKVWFRGLDHYIADGDYENLDNWRILCPFDPAKDLERVNAEKVEEKPTPKPGETWEVKVGGEWRAGLFDEDDDFELSGSVEGRFFWHIDETDQLGNRILLPGEEVEG